MPTGDLSNGAATGFHVQGASSYHRARWPIALRGEVAYHQFGSKDYSVAGQRGQTINYTGKSSSIAGIIDAAYSLPVASRMKPYLLGGPGVYNNRSEVTRSGGTSTNTSDTKVGVNVGGGMNFSLIGRSAYVEARYHHADQAAWIPITVGMRF
jgi:opacity protein-like surface antigen